MLLKEIVEDADLLVNNSLSITQKIRYFNQVQRELYRDYPLDEKAYYFQTVPQSTNYVLPTDCLPENIIGVYINESEYNYVTAVDVNRYNIYTFSNGELFIQPTPQFKNDSYVYYKAKPQDVTAADLDKEVPFLPDYQEIFVLGIARKLALIEKDYKTAEQLEVRYQSLANDALVKLNRVKLKKIRLVRGWM